MPASSRSERERRDRHRDQARSVRQSYRNTAGRREAYHDAPWRIVCLLERCGEPLQPVDKLQCIFPVRAAHFLGWQETGTDSRPFRQAEQPTAQGFIQLHAPLSRRFAIGHTGNGR